MPLSHYLNEDRICILQGQTPQAAINELAGLICKDHGGLSQARILEAVLARERDVGTQVGAQLAMPHARLPNVGLPVMAVGVSREGIVWGGAPESSVHLVILLIGDVKQPQDLLTALATMARTFQDENALIQILSAGTRESLYRMLTEHTEQSSDTEALPDKNNLEALYSSACALAKEANAGCMLFLVEHRSDLSFVAQRPPPCSSVLVTNPRRQLTAPDVPFERVIEMPLRGLVQRHALDLALLMAVSREIIEMDETVVCLYGSAASTRLDTVSLLNVREDLRIPLSLHDELSSGEIDFQVLLRVFTLTTELAQEGREGKPLGTLFVLGDHEAVSERSNQLVINPFKGYGDEEKNILDPSLAETVKEFAHIDGAFTVRGDGVILSAGTFVRSDVIGDSLVGGLGARHAAGQSITATTRALSIVLSESTGTITLYKNGRCVLSLKRGDI